MGIVFKPEPLPPGWDGMSLEEKRAWYHRVRGDAVARMERQRKAFPFLGLAPPPQYPAQRDEPVTIGGSAPGTFVCLLAIAAAATFLFFAFY